MPKKTRYGMVVVIIMMSSCSLRSLDHLSGGKPTFYWYADGEVSGGTPTNPFRYREPYEFDNRKVIGNRKILAVAIAASNNHVYYWYNSNEVSSGTTDEPTKYRPFTSANLSPEKTLIAAGIAKDDRVYYWYSDSTASSGTTTEPTKYRNYYPVNILKPIRLDSGLVQMKPPVAIAISKINDRVYYWYENELLSIGTTDHATRYADNIDSNVKCAELIGVADSA